MKTFAMKAASVAMVVLWLSGIATAQGVPQTVLLANIKVDVHKLSSGYRASKIIGAGVYNDNNDSVGKIDDIITSPDERDSYVVIGVGGFLGMGSKLVIVPFQNLKIENEKIVLSGATKEALKSLPDFKYAQ